MHLKETCALSSKSSLICSRDATRSIAGTCYCGARHLESWENSVIPTDLDHRTLPAHLQLLLWPCAPHTHKKKFVIHFNKYPTINGWEGDSFSWRSWPRGATKKKKKKNNTSHLSSNAQRVMYHFTIIFKFSSFNDIQMILFWVKTYYRYFLIPDSNHNSSKSICLKMLLCDYNLKEKAFWRKHLKKILQICLMTSNLQSL